MAELSDQVMQLDPENSSIARSAVSEELNDVPADSSFLIINCPSIAKEQLLQKSQERTTAKDKL
jgi:hypothetical protein